jgi:hypothetical protein
MRLDLGAGGVTTWRRPRFSVFFNHPFSYLDFELKPCPLGGMPAPADAHYLEVYILGP